MALVNGAQSSKYSLAAPLPSKRKHCRTPKIDIA